MPWKITFWCLVSILVKNESLMAFLTEFSLSFLTAVRFSICLMGRKDFLHAKTILPVCHPEAAPKHEEKVNYRTDFVFNKHHHQINGFWMFVLRQAQWTDKSIAFHSFCFSFPPTALCSRTFFFSSARIYLSWGFISKIIVIYSRWIVSSYS